MTIDLSAISFNGNFGSNDICSFSFQQNGKFYTTGAFRIYKNRTTEIVKPDLSVLSTMEAMIDLLYPVGSIYTSMNDINPSKFLGGTWKQTTGGGQDYMPPNMTVFAWYRTA